MAEVGGMVHLACPRMLLLGINLWSFILIVMCKYMASTQTLFFPQPLSHISIKVHVPFKDRVWENIKIWNFRKVPSGIYKWQKVLDHVSCAVSTRSICPCYWQFRGFYHLVIKHWYPPAQKVKKMTKIPSRHLHHQYSYTRTALRVGHYIVYVQVYRF